MRVEVDYGDRAIDFVDGTEDREGDSVIATEGDDAGVGFAFEGGTGFIGIGGGGAREESMVAVFDLFDSIFVVVTKRRLDIHLWHEEDD